MSPMTPRPRQPLPSALLCALLLGGCAVLPDPQPRVEPRALASYASAQSLSSPSARWPADRWWSAYSDPQLDTLIDEALRGAPSLAIAQARLAQAVAVAQTVGAQALPQLGASASVSQQKQSLHYLSPEAVTPHGWNDYGRATLDFSWELDFWGKNRAAIAAATSQADAARADVAQARLVLASAVAAAYAELARLHAARDTAA